MKMVEVIQEGGWVKGHRHNHRGERCLLGVLDFIYGVVPSCIEVSNLAPVERLATICEQMFPDRTNEDLMNYWVRNPKVTPKPECIIAAVNNHPSTTLHDVLEIAAIYDSMTTNGV